MIKKEVYSCSYGRGSMYVFLRYDALVEVLDKFLWMIFFTQLHVVDNGIVESDKYYIIGFLGKYNILLK